MRYRHYRESTMENYYKIWKLFSDFYLKLDSKPNNWEDHLTLFIGYLIQRNRKSTTIHSYVSALKAVLKDDGVKIEENIYLITSLTKACRIHKDKVQLQHPIRKDILHRLIGSLKQLYQDQPYLFILYKVLFLIMYYYGLLRIGEVIFGKHTIKAKNIHIATNKHKLKLVLHSSKTHGENVHPQIIKIIGHPHARNKIGNDQNCPFSTLQQFVQVRRHSFKMTDEPFFIFRDRSPVLLQHMRTVLKRTLMAAGYDHKLFKVHGLRAGRASDLLRMKVPIETIQHLGHWKSNAVYAYLKESSPTIL